VKARSALVVALALALTATSCGQGDPTPERAVPRASSTSTSAATTPPTSSPTRPAPLEWEGCGDGECATLAVPVDHDEPAGPTLELALARLPATGDRIGPLLVNFGGPGSRTVELLGGFPWPDAVRQRFDIVAVDPRGVGSSSPLRCGPPAAEVYDLDHAVDDAAERQALVELSERYAADCAERHGALLPRVGTADVARDLDLVRAALGDEQLSYLGFSYGTSIGQVYADRFPERVRAMVLDGVVDPSLDGLATAAQQAVGFEVALERWAGGCADRPTCPGPDPIAAVDDVLAAVEAGIPAGDRSLGPGEATIGLALALYAESLWPALDQAIADARDGSGGELLALADQYGSLVELPATGCTLPVPALPGGREWTTHEQDRWAELWASPQATQWDETARGTVAALVIFEGAILSGTASAWQAQEARYAAEALGLTPRAMTSLGWRIEE